MITITRPDITDTTLREFLALLGAAGLITGCATARPTAPPTTRPYTAADPTVV